MVKWKQYDIYLLLGSLFVFSFGIGLLHIGKKDKPVNSINTLIQADAQNSLDSSYLNESVQFMLNLKSEELIEYLKPFLVSRSVEKIVYSLKDIPAREMVSIARSLINNKNIPLLLIDKQELLLELAALYPDEQEQTIILNLFFENKDLLKGRSLIAVAAEVPVENALPVFINWYNTVKDIQTNSENFRSLIPDAFEYAIEENKIALFTQLKKYIALTKEQANKLLWHVIEKNGLPEFVPLLTAANANLNTIKNKKTPLIEAVLNQNYQLVEALIKSGAQVNMVPDNATGSALQNLLRKSNVYEQEKDYQRIRANIQIEQLLRDYGARE